MQFEHDGGPTPVWRPALTPGEFRLKLLRCCIMAQSIKLSKGMDVRIRCKSQV
ncbi:hypothetical protein [Labrys monachus]|uniref:Uncharacterized protein n=1 Tax=Labrys monachus TaxID=217067 RepID=A0ABU0FEH9_9HYPH|nr:hypothetical protein [Labrys monachus]MDQ0393019.1 hypothetical protein [Labrys monachus]